MPIKYTNPTKFNPINDKFGYFVECNSTWSHILTFVSLIEFDFSKQYFHKLHTFQISGYSQQCIWADESNASKFVLVLKEQRNVKVIELELSSGKVNIISTVQFQSESFFPGNYFRGSLYGSFVHLNQHSCHVSFIVICLKISNIGQS
jgi:hypothetical protein